MIIKAPATACTHAEHLWESERVMSDSGGKRLLRRLCLCVWASPASLLGLSVAVLGLPFGVRMQLRRGAVECHGGPIALILQHLLPISAMAMTLGHVIWGVNPIALELTREHEHVHVRQYERWGPLFIPAYLLSSIWLLVLGRNAYLENPFEREAFDDDRRRASLNSGDIEPA